MKTIKGKKIIIQNRKANFQYSIIETFEAGIVLLGADVKQLLNEKIDLTTAYCDIKDAQIFICNVNFHTNNQKKLLMHKKEILKLFVKVKENHYSIIPLEVYENNNLFKVKIGLAKPKKNYDKREKIKEKDSLLKINRLIKK